MSNEYMDEMQSGASGTGAVPDDGMPAGPEDGVVAAPVHTPVAGTRAFSQVRIDRMICRKSTLRPRG